MSIEINNTGITIRPSSLDNSMACAYQWAKVFLEGMITIPNSRAAIGTGIHKAIEVMWQDAIKNKVKDPNVDMMFDAGVEAFQEEVKRGEMRYDDGETIDTCNKEIVSGTQAFVDDLIPFLNIPTAVEQRFTVPISNHPIVKDISGTVDYLAPGILDDVKTSKRKPIPSGYVIQQSIYKYLAEENGHKIDLNRIQGVALLKSGPKCHLLEMESDIPRAKYAVNNLLDKLTIAVKDIVPIEVLFHCNTKYYLCSRKYCTLYGNCPATMNANSAEHKKPLL